MVSDRLKKLSGRTVPPVEGVFMETKEAKALSETLFEEISFGINLKLVDLTDEELAELERLLVKCHDGPNRPKVEIA